MNKKILETLEFEKVKSLLAPFLQTAQGKVELELLFPMAQADKIRESFLQLSELIAVVADNGSLPVKATADLTEATKRLELKAVLSAKEFAAIKRLLDLSESLRLYFESAANVDFPNLAKLTEKLQTLPTVRKSLSVIDEAGALYDTASAELLSLRRANKTWTKEIQQTMQELLGRYASQLSENIITQRNGHPVLAVLAGSKNKVSGVVQDISSSGATLYIEPQAVVSLNQALSQGKIKEKNEISRILLELTESLSPYVTEIRQNAWLIGQLDLFLAKARFMRTYRATIPQVLDNEAAKDKAEIMLYQARHPLIEAKKVVANDILFDKNLSTIVITGPNTGGKTILLKTLGLSVLMAQAGLPILADECSSLSVFKEVFADIGDEQSISANLSTFSSHMTKIVQIVNKADKRTLVLLDELGAGTDPKEGAALAQAILENLKEKGVKCLATTHYPELKAYAYDTASVSNASMTFDMQRLQPTYHFQLGLPGHSNAFEISRRLGLGEKIVKAAESFSSDEEHDITNMLDHLTEQMRESDEKLAEAKKIEYDNQLKAAQLDNRLMKLDREHENILNQGRQEAQDIVKQADKEAQKILAELTEKSNLKPHEVINARQELKALAPDLSTNKVLKKAKKERERRILQAGAKVKVLSVGGQVGELLRQEKDGRWLVAVGNLTTKLPENDFEVLEGPEKPKAKSSAFSKKANRNMAGQLDLRGQRYDEALLELENYIDLALLNNMNQITIVHGIGTGVIRNMVRNTLAKHRHIKSFGYAPINAGGSGATIAILK